MVAGLGHESGAERMDRIRISADHTTAEFDLRLGGRLTSLKIKGQERLLGAPMAGETSPDLAWGAYLMAPWAGRVEFGKLAVDGGEIQLRTNLPPHSIHGIVYDSPVIPKSVTSTQIVTTADLNWALGGTVTQTANLRQDSLELRAEVAGRHPWFLLDPLREVSLQGVRPCPSAWASIA
jgi:aldose 1-epimerase